MDFWYVIKDYTDDDFDNKYMPQYSFRKGYDHDSVARAIAEEHFYSDPCAPDNFQPTIGVKDEKGLIKWFSISAEQTVYFRASEISLTPPNAK